MKFKLLFLTVLFLGHGSANASDFKMAINDKVLIMKEACAGISLKKSAGILGTAGRHNCEIEIGVPSRVKWLDNRTFVLIENQRVNNISPPRVFIYKIKSVNGKKVVLT